MLKDLADSKRIDAHIWSKLKEMDGGEFLNTIKDGSFGEEDVDDIDKCLEEGRPFVLKEKEKEKEKENEEEEEEEEVNEDVETFHATIVSRMCWPTMESEIDYRPPARFPFFFFFSLFLVFYFVVVVSFCRCCFFFLILFFQI